MASFSKRTSASGKVYYQAIWFTKDVVTGKRKQNTRSFDKQGDAKAFARQMEREIEDAGVNPDKSLTFAKHVAACLIHWESNKAVRPNSIDTYRHNLNLLSRELGDVELSKITAKHLAMAEASLLTNGGMVNNKCRDKANAKRNTLSRQTVSNVMKNGKAVLDVARQWKLIPFNPYQDHKPLKVGKQPGVKTKTMTNDQAMAVYHQSIREAAKYPGIDVMTAVLYMTGLRISELLGLAEDAIDLDAMTITIRRTVINSRENIPVLREDVTKTDAGQRVISIPAELVPLIKRQQVWVKEQMMAWGRADYQTEPLLLFPDLGGAPRKPSTFACQMKRLQKRVGITGKPPTHTFRHGMASGMLAGGVDIKTISDFLGHGSVAFTLKTYIEAVDGTNKSAAALNGARFSALGTG